MNLSESFFTAFESITANKLRTTLTMLGVIIGVAAVIALMAIGNGVNNSVTSEITSIGTNLIQVSPNRDESSGYSPLGAGDVEALAAAPDAPAVAEVAAITQGAQEVVRNGQSVQTTVAGITANYLKLTNLAEFAAGDGLTESDVADRAPVVVLGAEVAGELFGSEYAVGEKVKINGVSYEVVGVLAAQGQTIAGNADDNVYMPLSTAQVRLYPDRTRHGDYAVSGIIAQAAGKEQTDAAVEQIAAILRDEHRLEPGDEDDFSIINQADLLQTLDQVTGTLTAFLGAIAAISLLVGGIGIMNIMLVSVTERTREIGIRKAVGALRRDILAQFLVESLAMSLAGGLIGIGLGWSLATGAGLLLQLATSVDPTTVVLAVAFAGAVGLVFGIYPAWRAANLRPIESLRYE